MERWGEGGILARKMIYTYIYIYVYIHITRGCGGYIPDFRLDFTLGCSATEQWPLGLFHMFLDLGSLQSVNFLLILLISSGGASKVYKIDGWKLQVCAVASWNFPLALLLIFNLLSLERCLSVDKISVYTGHTSLLLIEHLEGSEYQTIPSEGNTRTNRILLVSSLAQQIFKWSSANFRVFVWSKHFSSMKNTTFPPWPYNVFSKDLRPCRNLMVNNWWVGWLKLFQVACFFLQLIVDSLGIPKWNPVGRKYRQRFLQDGGL